MQHGGGEGNGAGRASVPRATETISLPEKTAVIARSNAPRQSRLPTEKLDCRVGFAFSQ